jgi:hypothetical protein
MKRIRYMQAGWVMLLAVLLLGLVVTPAGARSSTMRHTAQPLNNTTSVNATIYITTGTLEPIFQSRIQQQVPVAVNGAISNIVGKLPQQDHAWAAQMANTLIQPSATLTGLTTEQGGLVTSLQVTLYPGDPQPINASMLISLRVIGSSTVQVSATPLNGSPALVDGPLTTFQIPIGQLNSINTTPTCGASALAVRLLFPLSLAQGQATTQVQQTALNSFVSRNAARQPLNQRHPGAVPGSSSTNTNSYVELPASSLSSMGDSVGDLPVSNGLTAKNIQIGVQGSNLLINSDIYDSFFGKIGTATTTVAPTASGGNLAVYVLSTTLNIFGIFTFPYNSYNQQIEQTLNSKLNGALRGKFYVTHAAIGPNAQLPCAAGDSLVLTGSASLG